MMQPKVSLIKCTSYKPEDVEAAVKRSIDLLGGIDKFIKPDEKVLIKPNLLTDAKPEEGITTHPEVVRAVIRALKSVTRNIYCGDAPNILIKKTDIDRVYEVSGIKEVCFSEGVELVYFTSAKVYGSYPLTDWLSKCDKLVSIPKFKTHGLTILTAGIKNLFGLVVGLSKVKVHRDFPRSRELSQAMVDIYEIRKPDLTILDGVIAMEGQGPGTSGSLKRMDLLAASSDALALDIILSCIMGLTADRIPTNREAWRRGLDPKDPAAIEVMGEDYRTFIRKDFKLPRTPILNVLPDWLIFQYQKKLYAKHRVLKNKCRLCGACAKICPAGAIHIEKRHVLMEQEKCILCMCCQEICPEGAIDFKKTIFLRLLESKVLARIWRHHGTNV